MNASAIAPSLDIHQPETWAGKRIREIRQSALNLLHLALSSPLVTAAQRELATTKAEQCQDIWKLLRWHKAVVAYVAGVAAGQREPVAAPVAKPVAVQAPAPEVASEVQQTPRPKTRLSYRPARRMSAEKHARLRTANQLRRDKAAQRTAPTPMWAEALRLSALPGGLYWSGEGQVPEVGKALMVSRPGGLSGKATVKGYFHAEGFLGIVADFEKVPAKFQQSPRAQYVFG